MSPKLSHDFIRQLAAHGASNPRFKWFVTAIVALSSLNYPEAIGPLYQHLLEEYIPVEDHAAETRKIRESLVKAAGLHGAAKVSSCFPVLTRPVELYVILTSYFYRLEMPCENYITLLLLI